MKQFAMILGRLLGLLIAKGIITDEEAERILDPLEEEEEKE